MTCLCLKTVALGELSNHRNACGVFFTRESRVAQARVGSWLGARGYERPRPPLSARVLTRQRGSDGSRGQTLRLSPAESGSG
jgi:hypothetical protein